jgi:F0F1-type ATP synthase assembly protein I
MPFPLKLLLSNLIILLCVWLGRRFPSLAGLIATMPLTSLIVLLWLQSDNPSARGDLSAYVGGVFFGVLPTLCFFGVVWFCLRRGMVLPASLAAGFAVWAGAAFFHQLFLR